MSPTQSSQWRLLTKKEIHLLTPPQLASYLQWLEQEKKKQLEEIAQKKALLDKILKENLEKDEQGQKKTEHTDIETVRKFLMKTA